MSTPAPLPELVPLASSKAWSFGCLGAMLLVSLGSCLLPASMALVVEPKVRGVMIMTGVGTGLLMLFVFGFTMGILVLMRRRSPNLPILTALHAQHGGTFHAPSFTSPLTPPTWIGTIDGAQVRVSISRNTRSRGGAGLAYTVAKASINATQTWKIPHGNYDRLLLDVRQPCAFLLSGVCRTGLSGLSKGLAPGGVAPFETGNPTFDGNFLVLSNDPQRGAAVLTQHHQAIEYALTLCAPYVCNFKISPQGASWQGVASEKTTPEAISYIASALVGISRGQT